ncbi:MAG: hypothetical protein Kow00127_16940 [Bacteroidales bacterium]
MKEKDFLDKLFEFESPEEKLEHETYMLSFKFMHVVEQVMEAKNLNNKELAALIGTSASYITQLFRGNKLLNFKTLARLQEALDIRFDISIEDFEKSGLLNKDNKGQGIWVYRNFRKPILNEFAIPVKYNEKMAAS